MKSVPRRYDIAVRQDEASPREAARVVAAAVDVRLTPQSHRTLTQLFLMFTQRVEDAGRTNLREITKEDVERFVTGSDAEAPARPLSSATMHLRRSAIRLLFHAARSLHLTEEDPTLDLPLPPRSSLPRRPLTDDEVALCRAVAESTPRETRLAAVLALAEAGIRTGEMPLIRISHLDPGRRRVFISGGARTDARWGHLTTWGSTQLERRVQALSVAGNDPPLVYGGRVGRASAQASCCAAIGSVLARAGLAGEPNVTPNSVAAWSGARNLAAGLPLEEVARRLGMRSLDQAARFIAWDWRVECESPEAWTRPERRPSQYAADTPDISSGTGFEKGVIARSNRNRTRRR